MMTPAAKRAYAKWYAKNKDRKRAEEKDVTRLMRRLEINPDGVQAILDRVKDGSPYIEIAIDWLMDTRDVSLLATAHGIFRCPRTSIVASQHLLTPTTGE